jgi:hypothetical protein
MTPAEVAEALALAAAYDQRTVGEFDVGAWHQVLADLDAGDVRAAIVDYYRDNRARIMPADIRHRVTAVRHARLYAAGDVLPDLDPDDPAYFARLREHRAAIAAGSPPADRGVIGS